MSSSLAVCAAYHYSKLHQPEPVPPPFPGDTIFPGLAYDVANRRQNVSMAALLAMLSCHFHNQRPVLADNPPPPRRYAASAKSSFCEAVRLKRT